MARKKNLASVNKNESQIVATLDDTVESSKEGETVLIACHIPFDMRFDGLKDKNGNEYSYTIKGLNSSLRGKAGGVLTIEGSLAQSIEKDVWDEIIRVHGRETVFTGLNGGQPCIRLCGKEADFKAMRSELKEQRHGLEPIDPASLGVAETLKEDLPI